MRITVFGASGKVGQEVVKGLLAGGHEVIAFVHNSTLPGISSPALKIVTGDIHDYADVQQAVNGSAVIISALGSWGTQSKDILSAATKNIAAAIQAQGIKRFISVTGSVARLPGEDFTFTHNAIRMMLGVVAKPILKDAEEHLKILSESSLDWTVIRSPIMTGKKTAGYNLSLKPPALWALASRTAVVKALIDAAESNSFSRQAPFISNE